MLSIPAQSKGKSLHRRRVRHSGNAPVCMARVSNFFTTSEQQHSATALDRFKGQSDQSSDCPRRSWSRALCPLREDLYLYPYRYIAGPSVLYRKVCTPFEVLNSTANLRTGDRMACGTLEEVVRRHAFSTFASISLIHPVLRPHSVLQMTTTVRCIPKRRFALSTVWLME